MRSCIIIFTCFSLAVSGIVMPYADYSNTIAVKMLYHSIQQEDSDLDLAEFIGDKLLGIGELLENDDTDQPAPRPLHSNLPPSFQFQAGALYCNPGADRTAAIDQQPVEHLSIFQDNKFARELPATIFHPPSATFM